MLAQTRLLERLDSLPDDLIGFVRLREALDVTSFTGWLKGQTLLPRIYWHARERDREFAAIGILHQIDDEAQLATLHNQPRPMAGDWPRYSAASPSIAWRSWPPTGTPSATAASSCRASS